MNSAMGLFSNYTKLLRHWRIVAFILIGAFDVVLFLEVHKPNSVIPFLKSLVAFDQPQKSAYTQITPDPTSTPAPSDAQPSGAQLLASAMPQTSPTPLTSATPTPISSSTPSSAPPSTTSPTATPASSEPSSTPSPTATPLVTPTPTPTPTPATTSPVYITGYIYANNVQIVAEQNPVKVFNAQTNTLLFSGETDHQGKSPTWNVPADTQISIFLYPKQGMQGCGDQWSFTTGSLGTLETHNLSIQGDRSPCITL